MLRQWDGRSIRCARYPRSRRCSGPRHGVLLLHSTRIACHLRSAPPVSRRQLARPWSRQYSPLAQTGAELRSPWHPRARRWPSDPSPQSDAQVGATWQPGHHAPAQLRSSWGKGAPAPVGKRARRRPASPDAAAWAWGPPSLAAGTPSGRCATVAPPGLGRPCVRTGGKTAPGAKSRREQRRWPDLLLGGAGVG